MEVKIIHPRNRDGLVVTNLFEGDNIYHYYIPFSNKNDFIEKYNFETNHELNGTVIGLPEDIWKSDGDQYRGTFLVIFYEKDQQLNFIVTMNSKVYITCKGQTVDVLNS